ncbi:MAG: PD-(D/E)XK nuclease domain-containing protein, partial [Bacteroidales bacterium]|nr:PD-(D/E)XK nuclease domain-containing protein [Bacteroidales bacterium]
PIKKFKTESALNNFWEYSMVDPKGLAQYLGFTKTEVKALCEKYEMDFDEMVMWYDGYRLGLEPSMFNPNSVMMALNSSRCRSYWAATGAFDAVVRYIQMDYEGLKSDIVQMLGGACCPVKTTRFRNDPNEVLSKDDVLTILIHLGYLAYDESTLTCHIPNKEVAGEMEGAIEENNWREVIDAINASEALLESLLEGDAEAVAAGVEKVHEESASILRYNNENALSCVINLAFYTARNKYQIIREFPSGKGFADVVFIPRRNVDLPAIVVELKWKHDAQTAIDQIRERNYPASLMDYSGNVILCGINYAPETKMHSCIIEKV